MKRPASLVAGIFLVVLALAQLTRAAVGLDVRFGDFQVPVVFSWIAGPVIGSMALFLLKERSKEE